MEERKPLASSTDRAYRNARDSNARRDNTFRKLPDPPAKDYARLQGIAGARRGVRFAGLLEAVGFRGLGGLNPATQR